ncbi:MAG: DUF2330 domain-containing protein [Planctomycetota bacterium]
MKRRGLTLKWFGAGLLSVLSLVPTDRVAACGGFFCQLVPIDQAGEQIIFRQDGMTVTAVVLIQYVGAAEGFSWVVPVPGIPELSTGSDLVFSPLELATRPQFILEVNGFCEDEAANSPQFGSAPSVDNDNASPPADDGVTVLQTLVVGPFDAQIVSSDDPQALATWLIDNGYTLSDRGRELIAPYVAEGKNFIGLRLRKDQGVGDIRPIIMRYQSEVPEIPIRLTAVAAQPDMGVLVWLLGSARAAPLNYLHVTPNYTRLNWYQGTFNAYASYQDLITAAMDEAGGQGFATDYAGRDIDILAQLPTVDSFVSELVFVSSFDDDADFVEAVATSFVFPNDQVLEILHRFLPLRGSDGDFIYQISELISTTYTVQELAVARTNIVLAINDDIIGPLRETLDVFQGNLYLTRFYTTLSPEEMTLDPIFSFNPDLPDQRLDRNAKLDVRCGLWSLTLGEGTGRDGELVIEGSGSAPGFFSQVPTIEQDAVFLTETVSMIGPPQTVTQKQFPIARINISNGTFEPVIPICGAGSACGAGSSMAILLTMFGLRLVRRRP